MFDEQLQRCEICSQQWNKRNTLDSWYIKLRSWVESGQCKFMPQGIDPFFKAIPSDEFKACLQSWLKDDVLGSNYQIDIKFD